ncbi:tetratricopeptide repeat protein [Thermodesulfobacteriota bacterium]
MKQQVIKSFLVLLLFGGLGFGIYSNTLETPFYFDDHVDITENTHIRITGLSFNELKNAGFKSPASSRPISNISFALNYYFHQYDLFGYHVVNIIVHILAGIFLYFFIKITLDLPCLREQYRHPVAIAFPAALIWLVHPLHTQSVTYVVQRMNSMAAMLFILSLLMYVKGRMPAERRKSWLWFLGAGLAWLISLGCKQISATLPFFIFLYEWYFFQDLDRNWIKHQMKYVLGVLILFGLVALAYLWPDPFEALTNITDYASKEFTLTQRIFTQFRVVVYYISLLFYPHPSRLNLDYDFPLSHSLFNPATTLISFFTVMVLVGFSFYAAKRERLGSFCILWFFGNLVIESSVIPLALIFEHRTYLPSMLFPLLMATLADRYIHPKYINVLLLCLLLSLLSIWTYERNNFWGNSAFFWRDCIIKSPQKARPKFALGMALEESGQIDEAFTYYHRALQIDPDFVKVHYALGKLLTKQDRMSEAVLHYSEALRLKPDFVDAHLNLGNVLLNQGKIDEAVKHYYEALRLNPGYAKVHVNLGNALARLGRTNEALEHLREALRLDPQNSSAHNNLGGELGKQGMLTEAIDHFSKAVRLDPGNARARNNLEAATAVKNRIEAAIAETRYKLDTNPENPGLYFNLGNLYKSMGEFEAAITQYQKALSIQPDFIPAANNLAIVYLLTSELDNALVMFEKIAELEPDDPAAYYNVACVQARMNRVDAAVDWLKKAVGKGYDRWELIKTDKDLENIRNSPDYKALIKRHRPG